MNNVAQLPSTSNPTTDDPFDDKNMEAFSEKFAAQEAAAAEKPKVKVPVDPETGAELPFLLQRGNRLWFLKQDGTYSASVNAAQDFYRGAALKQHLKWAIDGGVMTMTYLDKKGEERPKNKETLMNEYGVFVEGGISMSLSAASNVYTYARDGHLTEALCPVRKIAPRRDPQIERWLQLLGGDNHAKLLDWIATITQLDRPSAILLIVGEPGVGKGLLLEGLARLWGSSYTRLYDFCKKFNGAITHSPLVGVDEGSDDRDKTVDTKTLRSVSAQSQFFIEKKGADQVPAEGAVRILIACNDIGDALKFNEDLNASSRDAVQNRFLVVRPDSVGAAEYLRQIGGRSTTDRWVRGDALAAHALWLRETRQVTLGARFAVESAPDEEFRSFISLSSNSSVAVASWMIKYLTHPEMLTNKQDWIQVRDGKLWVYPDLFDDLHAWETFVNVKHPGPKTVKSSLEVLGVKSSEEYRPYISSGSPGVSKKKIHPRFKQIDVGILFQQARSLGIGDEDAMRATLAGEAQPEEDPLDTGDEAADKALLDVTPDDVERENKEEGMIPHKRGQAAPLGLHLPEELIFKIPAAALRRARELHLAGRVPPSHPLSAQSLTAFANTPF